MVAWGVRMGDLLLLAGENNTVVLGLEPLHGVLLGQLVLTSDCANLTSPLQNKLMKAFNFPKTVVL